MGSQTGRVRVAASVTLDMLATVAAYLFAPWARRALQPYVHEVLGDWAYSAPEYALLLVFVVALWAALLAAFGCYERDRRLTARVTAWRVFKALVLAHLALALVAFYAKVDFLSRGVMVIFFWGNYAGIMAGRLLVAVASRTGSKRRTLVVGSGEVALRMADTLAREEGHQIVGFVRIPGETRAPEDRILGEVGEIARIVETRAPVDEVAVALPPEELTSALLAVEACEERGIAVRQLVLPLGAEPRKTTHERVGGLDMLTTHPSPAGPLELLVKRLFDIAASVVGLLATALLFPFIAAAVKLSSKGPVFYKQKRVGLSGRFFTIHKFRTMVVGAHQMRDGLAEMNVMEGPRFKIEKDPRVTGVGRILRRLSLDELPQFWNVLKGDMSVVGPRPFPVEEVADYEGRHHRRLAMKAGLTGLWQTDGRCEIRDFEDMLRMDEEYIRNWSLWLDVKILLKTIPAIIGGRGAM
jgi:exopolysaccharide biosynthesis polyprenyl glycosylphosphotransferase